MCVNCHSNFAGDNAIDFQTSSTCANVARGQSSVSPDCNVPLPRRRWRLLGLRKHGKYYMMLT